MENYVVCPKCNRTITDNPIIDAAARGELHGSEYIICECGQNITFWAVTAQLRDHKKISQKVKDWWQKITKTRT